MTGLGPIGGALALLGLAIYAVIQVVKASTGAEWRATRTGRGALKAAPLVVGAALAAVPGVLDGLAELFGGPIPDLALAARTTLGVVAGSFSTTIHAIARRKVEAAGAGGPQ